MFNGKLLKQARKEKGYTLHQLSKAIEEKYDIWVSPKTIGNWEVNLNAHPKNENLENVCEFLGISTKSLYDVSYDIDILEVLKRVIEMYQKGDPYINKITEIIF